MRTSKRGLSTRQVGLKYGFRSGLEEKVAADLEEKGVPFDYEKHVIRYVKPARDAKYTPDFLIRKNGILVETKGRFVTEDRQKHLLIRDQHPNLDIRFVFSNPNARISKKSKTTYAMWCEKHGFLYAKQDIPLEWLREKPKAGRTAALSTIGIILNG
jgi:hypothetical protein